MKIEDQILFANRLLDLMRQVEMLAKDYCRLLTAQEDGHWLEQRDREEPF